MKNAITYRQVGDYLIPNLVLTEEEKRPIGVWGTAHKDYLMKHNKLQFNLLLTSGKLTDYLVNVNNEAEELFSRLVKDMKKAEGVTELLKSKNQMEWVGRMNNIEARAREVVCSEIIYA